MSNIADKLANHTYFDAYLEEGKKRQSAGKKLSALAKIPLFTLEILLGIVVIITAFISVHTVTWND